MKKLFSAISLSLLICGCEATDQNVNNYTLQKVSAVKIDESNVVLKTLPNTSIMFGKDHIISAVEYTRFVEYNLQNGKVELNFSIDSLMQNSQFDIKKYVQENCEKPFPARKYRFKVDDQGMVPFKIFKFPSKIQNLDSVVALIGIFTPYSSTMSYNGENVDAVYMSYSFALATIDFNNKKLKSIYHIKDYLLKHVEDTTETIFPYIETGTLLDNGRLLMTVQPSARSNNELVALSIGGSNALEICPTQYPQNTNEFARSILSFNLQKNRSGDLFYNSIYNIYNVSKLNDPKTVVDLKDKLNVSQKERINSFTKFDENTFLIQLLSTDSASGSTLNFKLFNTKTNKLSPSLMNYSATTALEYVLYTDDGFIKFTAKNENYYLEKYILKNRSSTAN